MQKKSCTTHRYSSSFRIPDFLLFLLPFFLQPVGSVAVASHWFNLFHISKNYTSTIRTNSNFYCYINRSCFTLSFKIGNYFIYVCLCFYRLFFIVCFLSFVFIVCFPCFSNDNTSVVLPGSKFSIISGDSNPSSDHVFRMSGTPLPARSPISIRLNIFINPLFRGSDTPPRIYCSLPTRIQPGFSSVSL